MKECNKCHKILEVSSFNVSRANKDGLQTKCKDCNSIDGKLYKRTFNGLMSEIYSSQKASSKSRGFKEVDYSKEWLETYCKNSEEFMNMFNEWEKANHQINLRPTIDRKDNMKGYEKDNIQPMTYRDNVKKEHLSRRLGNSNLKQKAVIQIDKNGNQIREFRSTMEASRETGANQSHIGSCCNGNRKTHKGYQWKFKEKT